MKLNKIYESGIVPTSALFIQQQCTLKTQCELRGLLTIDKKGVGGGEEKEKSNLKNICLGKGARSSLICGRQMFLLTDCTYVLGSSINCTQSTLSSEGLHKYW